MVMGTVMVMVLHGGTVKREGLVVVAWSVTVTSAWQ